MKNFSKTKWGHSQLSTDSPASKRARDTYLHSSRVSYFEHNSLQSRQSSEKRQELSQGLSRRNQVKLPLSINSKVMRAGYYIQASHG